MNKILGIQNDDQSVVAVVPTGETWTSGQVRQAADGRLGIVVSHPPTTGNAAGTEDATLDVSVGCRVGIRTSVPVVAGTVYGVDIANQQLVAAGGGDRDIVRAVYPAAVGEIASFNLN